MSPNMWLSPRHNQIDQTHALTKVAPCISGQNQLLHVEWWSDGVTMGDVDRKVRAHTEYNRPNMLASQSPVAQAISPNACIVKRGTTALTKLAPVNMGENMLLWVHGCGLRVWQGTCLGFGLGVILTLVCVWFRLWFVRVFSFVLWLVSTLVYCV